MTIDAFLDRLYDGETANFAIFGARAFQQTLGNLSIDDARKAANLAAKKNSLISLIVITPEWGGLQISF